MKVDKLQQQKQQQLILILLRFVLVRFPKSIWASQSSDFSMEIENDTWHEIEMKNEYPKIYGLF